mmetsp:Transcript_96795/g.307179  ORF Transcript_96795/g.307179 Transcript_96795/m.307179 type:complete len:129 (+) Transcript_96795:243-629(+)
MVSFNANQKAERPGARAHEQAYMCNCSFVWDTSVSKVAEDLMSQVEMGFIARKWPTEPPKSSVAQCLERYSHLLTLCQEALTRPRPRGIICNVVRPRKVGRVLLGLPGLDLKQSHMMDLQQPHPHELH